MNHNKHNKPWRLAALLALVCATLATSFAPIPANKAPVAGAAADIRWGFYVTYNPNSWTSLQANADKLNYASPWYFTLDRNARVNGTPQPHADNLLRQHGVKNLPMVKNSATYGDFHNILYDAARRDSVINQLRSIVQSKGYDGINIDWESVTASDEEGMTNFMKLLYQAFKADGKLVAMSVPAKGRDVNTGWAGAYNYHTLAPWSDYFIIMAYDKHYPGGTAGPVAPYSWINEIAGYTANTLGANKVVWGIGLYGYDWNTSANPRPQAESRTWAEAHALARQYNGTLRYDEAEHAYQLVYMKDNQRHEVWFEDRRSFEAKLNFVKNRLFAGFAVWRLGQEDPGVWEVIAGVKNESPCMPINPFPSSPTRVYFPRTGHSLGGGFLTYWLQHGGLPIFGYPLTEEFQEVNPTDGKLYTVQYFERNRFEWHPEFRGTDAEFQLGLLGVQYVEGRFFPSSQIQSVLPTEGVFFSQTQHTLQGGFRERWEKYGGLAQFGYPLSDEFQEISHTDGKTYTVQYFERARFEFHPENAGTDHDIQLGLLGTWALKQRGC